MVIRVDFDVLVGQITRPDRKFPAAGTKIKVNAKFLSSDQLGQLRLGRACIQAIFDYGSALHGQADSHWVKGNAAVAGGAENPSPVRVCSEPGGFAQG